MFEMKHVSYSCIMIKKRPIYEKKEDRKRQAKAMAELVDYLHSVSVTKQKTINTIEAPLLCPFDYEMTFKDKFWALVEVKCRTNKQDEYDNYMIGASKVQALVHAAKSRKLASYLLVSWADKVGVADAVDVLEQSETGWGGRHDRNDPADTEDVLHVPYSLFTIIKNIN